MEYKIKNWDQFQHYKDRNPPWIKLHFSLLSSEDWVMLDDASRLIAVVIMLVASRNNGVIDGTAKGLNYLQRIAYLDKKPNLKPLINSGFLVPVQADDSECKQMIADDTQEDMQSRADQIILEDNSCPELKKAPGPKRDDSETDLDDFQAEDIFLYLPLNLKNQHHPVLKADIELWNESYPNVDVRLEIRKMFAWLKANPKKRKTGAGINRFINSWLSREQDKGGTSRPPWNSSPEGAPASGDVGNWGDREPEQPRTPEEIAEASRKAENVLKQYHKL